MAQDICVIPKLVEAKRLALAHNVVPVTHSFVSDLETPISAFLKLGDARPAFLLESAEHGHQVGRYSFLGVGALATVRYAAGRLTVEGRRGRREQAHDDPFAAVADLLREYRPPASGGLPPLAGGLVGYFGYDLVRHLEHLPARPPDDLGLPEMAFLLADTVLVFDHLTHTITIVANALVQDGDITAPFEEAVQRIVAVKQRLAGPPVNGGLARRQTSAGRPAPSAVAADDRSTVTCTLPEREFEAGVRRIRDYIYAGDAFQVVLSRRFSVPIDVTPFAIYRALRTVNPSPYMYYIAFTDFALAGSSPEPLVTVTGRHVKTRPIAGTRPRGQTHDEDERLAADLLSDEKERAEHVMLVDLGRNDLGRVCAPGSVHVDELMEIERYSHVMHMVSSVSGTLTAERGAIDALKACFPAGTVSGAPKVRAMEIIDELEPVARGPYAGAIGYLSFTGDLDTCICIRTIVIKDGVAHVQAGAGVVADSDPRRESQETENKAAALLRAIDLAHEEFGAT